MMVCLCGGSVFQRSQTAGDLRSLPVECRQTALQGRNLPDDVVGTDHGTALPVVGFSSNILPAASSVSKMLSLRESVYTLRVKRLGMVRTEHGNCSCMEVFLTKISIESMQPMPPNRPSPATGPNPGTVVTKAALRAASQPEMTNRAFANVVGLSEATISRMRSKEYELQPDQKSYELALLFVRLYRSLDAIVGGDDAVAGAWLTNRNTALHDEPLKLIQTVPGLMNVIQYLDARRAVV